MKITLLFLSVFLSASLYGQPLTYVPDDNFENYIEANGMGNGIANDDYVLTNSIGWATSLDLHNLQISDLTGIEDFSALIYLYCSANSLTSLNLSNNISLTSLICNNNLLSSLDVSTNTELTYMNCVSNNLTSLDVSNQHFLTTFYCGSNQLYCLKMNNGNNTNMDIMTFNNPNLTCIEVDDANWSTSNWSNFVDFVHFFSEDCNYSVDCGQPTTEINNLLLPQKNLIQIHDLMGRETIFKPNTPLIYVYDDGSTEKVFAIE